MTTALSVVDNSSRSRRSLGRVLCASAALLVCSLVGITPSLAQSPLGPQGVVRRFCQVDGLGARTATATWFEFANLVEWPLEPVWDRAVLISGYEVGGPFVIDIDVMEVEVRYSVIGQISADGLGNQVYIERLNLRVRPDEAGNWRIMGPPPPPHLFAAQVDISAARRALEPGQSQYPTNSDFVWQMFRASGWAIEYESTAQLLMQNTFRPVDKPKPGDLVAYVDGGVAYHVGILDDETHVTSATVNGGVMRTPITMFAGDVVYLRLLQAPPTPTPTVEEEEEGDDENGMEAKVSPTEASPTLKPSPSPTSTPIKVATVKPNSVSKKTPALKRPALKGKPVTRSSKPTPGKARIEPPKSKSSAPKKSTTAKSGATVSPAKVRAPQPSTIRRSQPSKQPPRRAPSKPSNVKSRAAASPSRTAAPKAGSPKPVAKKKTRAAH